MYCKNALNLKLGFIFFNAPLKRISIYKWKIFWHHPKAKNFSLTCRVYILMAKQTENRIVQTRSIKDLPLSQVLLDCVKLFLLNHDFSSYYAHCLKDPNEPYLLCFSIEINLQSLNAASAFLFTSCCLGNKNYVMTDLSRKHYARV